MRRWLFATLLLLASCAPTPQAAGSIALAEGSLQVSSERFVAGELEFDVTNNGEFPHTLVVTTEAGEVVTATGLIQPGEELSVQLDLDVGDYEFSCRIVGQLPDGSILDHYEAGMRGDIEVRS